jgi:CubicO group peptidase (beta-lactamase class C family)
MSRQQAPHRRAAGKDEAMPDVDQLETRAWVDEILNRRPAVGFAIGVVCNGSLQFFHSQGMADIAAHRPVTGDTVFRIASITKTFTGIAVMQLWEQGLVDLDAPANDYLRAYQLVPAKASWRAATVRHLLTHTAGIAEQVPRSGMLRRDYGESVRLGRPVPSLTEYYRGALRLDAEPGTRFRYGDHSPATLGQLVEDVTGKPLQGYLHEHVFQPLGMADTTLVRSEVDHSKLATGYKLRSGGPEAVRDREVVTVGAGAAYSTPRDMARYLAALMCRGANEYGSVLKPATLASMFAPQYQPHPRIPGMGLAFWRRDAGGHRLVEHIGVLPGFDSQILIAPDDGLGVMAFTNGTHGGTAWLGSKLSTLVNRLLGVPDEVIRTNVPQRPEVWGDLCGWYYLPGPLTDVRLRAMLGAGVEVFVSRGQLFIRILSPIPALYKGFLLHPDDATDPYAFRIDFSEFGFGTVPVVFSREPETGTTAVHFGLMPLSAYRRPPSSNPRLWVEGAVAVAAIAVLGRHLRAAKRQQGRT